MTQSPRSYLGVGRAGLGTSAEGTAGCRSLGSSENFAFGGVRLGFAHRFRRRVAHSGECVWRWW